VEHFAKIIKKEKGYDIYEHPKSLLKLQKEAERVKIVLSANNEHQAQIESLFENYDFKSKITRETFELLSKDLFERISKPVNDAIKQAGVSLVSLTKTTRAKKL
jgi:molecular chaperone DnaK (HSP70)